VGSSTQVTDYLTLQKLVDKLPGINKSIWTSFWHQRRVEDAVSANQELAGNPTIARHHDLAVECIRLYFESRMTKRIANRLLAIAAIFALAVLATHAVSHWHSHAYDEDHCQICHVGHAAIPQPAAQIAVQPAAPTARLALAANFAPGLDFAGTPSIPRAPPS
jgi:hypothetical protein